MKRFLTLWLISIAAGPLVARDFYTSPNGRVGADGSFDDPFNFTASIDRSSQLNPGDTNWIRGGEYRLAWRGEPIYPRGTEDQPIVLRAFPGERPILQGRLEVLGDYLWFWGLEITSYSEVENWPILPLVQARLQEGVYAQSGLNLETALGCRIINCVLHDITEHSLIWTKASPSSEICGTLIFNSCLLAPDNARGLGVYAQNGDGRKIFRQNILMYNASGGTAFYSAGQAPVRNLEILENVWVANGLEPQNPQNCVIGSDSSVEHVQLSGNVFWNPPGSKAANVRNGTLPRAATDWRIEDNWWVHGGCSLKNLGEGFVFRLNQIFGGALSLDFLSAEVREQAQVDQNQYWGVRFYSQLLEENIVRQNPSTDGFEAWQHQRGSTGASMDQRSSFEAGPPSNQSYRLYANPYEPSRGHLAVLNFARDTTVFVDVSRLGWEDGQNFEIRPVQNYLAQRVTGIYQRKKIAVPMTGWGVAGPKCLDTRPLSTFPEFGVFVIRPIGPP